MLVEKARLFAYQAHGDQVYGGYPYIVHLVQVADILKSYGEEDQVLGYLHDVLEDTEVTQEELGREFGGVMAVKVWILSDEEGKNRKERKDLTYQKWRELSRTDITLDSFTVKAADRLANLRFSIETGNFRMLQMYRKEYPTFREILFTPGLCDEIWGEIDKILNWPS